MKKFLGIFMTLGMCVLMACGSAEEDTMNSIGSDTACENTASDNEPDIAPANEPVELVVYSQLSGYRGEQKGWFAQVMMERFNVKFTIAYDTSEDFQDGVEKGYLGDIIVFGNTGECYEEAIKNGLLLDWEKNGLLAEHGAYILENMSKALEHNRSLAPNENKIYGLGHGVATSNDNFEDVFLTWDIRWDLYKQLGYPAVNDLTDLTSVLKDMKELCPTDEQGNENYALSLWSDWDSNMVMYVKSMAGAYYGYDEFHLGLYDSDTGTFYDALEENGPYLEMLKYFNILYREGLLDPDSKTQTYEDVCAKTQNGGILFSIFNYAGSLSYNTENHLVQNKYMASLLPAEATPVTYGMSVYGGNRVWTIGANSEHKELCMEIINWLCTPEGMLTFVYGPKGVIWDYDAEGNTYFTELGKNCYEDRTTILPDEYGGGYYNDGCPQINNLTWNLNAENPDSNRETYNAINWKSNVPAASCETEQDWRDYTGTLTSLEYMKTKECVVVPATTYEAPEKSVGLQKAWEQVANCIVSESWNAIYAESDEEFEQVVSKMIAGAKACGYDRCAEWCEQEATRRFALEEAVRE